MHCSSAISCASGNPVKPLYLTPKAHGMIHLLTSYYHMFPHFTQQILVIFILFHSDFPFEANEFPCGCQDARRIFYL